LAELLELPLPEDKEPPLEDTPEPPFEDEEPSSSSDEPPPEDDDADELVSSLPLLPSLEQESVNAKASARAAASVIFENIVFIVALLFCPMPFFCGQKLRR
jgi:hypothetical protein